MRQSYCPHCRYDLAGLSRHGMCPECGKPYGFESSSLSTGQGPIARHGKWVSLVVLALMILLCGGAITISSQNRVTMLVVTLIVAALPAFGAFVYWWSDRADRRDRD